MTPILIIADGMADLPGHATDTRMTTLHSMPIVATRLTETRPGAAPSSERAIMSLLGYDISCLNISRSRLEALALGLDTAGRHVHRVNLTGPDGLPADVTTDEAASIASASALPLHPMDRYRMLLLTDSDAAPSLPDGMTLIAGDDALDTVEPLRYRTRIIGATHLIQGIALHVGAGFMRPSGATGHIDTDISTKTRAAIDSALSDDTDLTIVHIEAPDEAAHMRDPKLKADLLEQIDLYMIKPIVETGIPLTVCADHITDAVTGRHHQGAVAIRTVNGLCCLPSISPRQNCRRQGRIY